MAYIPRHQSYDAFVGDALRNQLVKEVVPLVSVHVCGDCGQSHVNSHCPVAARHGRQASLASVATTATRRSVVDAGGSGKQAWLEGSAGGSFGGTHFNGPQSVFAHAEPEYAHSDKPSHVINVNIHGLPPTGVEWRSARRTGPDGQEPCCLYHAATAKSRRSRTPFRRRRHVPRSVPSVCCGASRYRRGESGEPFKPLDGEELREELRSAGYVVVGDPTPQEAQPPPPLAVSEDASILSSKPRRSSPWCSSTPCCEAPPQAKSHPEIQVYPPPHDFRVTSPQPPDFGHTLPPFRQPPSHPTRQWEGGIPTTTLRPESPSPSYTHATAASPREPPPPHYTHATTASQYVTPQYTVAQTQPLTAAQHDHHHHHHHDQHQDDFVRQPTAKFGDTPMGSTDLSPGQGSAASIRYPQHQIIESYVPLSRPMDAHQRDWQYNMRYPHDADPTFRPHQANGAPTRTSVDRDRDLRVAGWVSEKSSGEHTELPYHHHHPLSPHPAPAPPPPSGELQQHYVAYPPSPRRDSSPIVSPHAAVLYPPPQMVSPHRTPSPRPPLSARVGSSSEAALSPSPRYSPQIAPASPQQAEAADAMIPTHYYKGSWEYRIPPSPQYTPQPPLEVHHPPLEVHQPSTVVHSFRVSPLAPSTRPSDISESRHHHSAAVAPPHYSPSPLAPTPTTPHPEPAADYHTHPTVRVYTHHPRHDAVQNRQSAVEFSASEDTTESVHTADSFGPERRRTDAQSFESTAHRPVTYVMPIEQASSMLPPGTVVSYSPDDSRPSAHRSGTATPIQTVPTATTTVSSNATSAVRHTPSRGTSATTSPSYVSHIQLPPSAVRSYDASSYYPRYPTRISSQHRAAGSLFTPVGSSRYPTIPKSQGSHPRAASQIRSVSVPRRVSRGDGVVRPSKSWFSCSPCCEASAESSSCCSEGCCPRSHSKMK